MNTTTTIPRRTIETPRIRLPVRSAAITAGVVVALLLAGLGARALVGSTPSISTLMLTDVEGHELDTASSGPVGGDGGDLAIPSDVSAELDAHVRWWRGDSSVVVAVIFRAPDNEKAEEAGRLMQASWLEGTETRFDVPGLPDASGTRGVQGETTLDAVVFTQGSYGATIGVINGPSGSTTASELALAQAALLP